MLGFGDFGVTAAYLICIISAAICVVYGLMNWNKDDELPDPVHPADEDLEFEETV